MNVRIHQQTECGDIVTLLEPVSINWGERSFTIPRGFSSDGASVPEFLWASVSPALDPRTLRGALAHDYIYRTRPANWSRQEADEMFYDLIREDGLSLWKALKAYFGVRLFGSAAWENK